MHAPGVTLVFESLTWQSALAVAGAVVLLAEALATLAPLRRARGAIFWIVLLAVGLAGVVLAWVWGSWAGSLTPLTRPLFASRSLPLLSRAALLAAMPTLVAACLLATVAVFHRLFAALAGATSIAAFAAAALYGLALLAVASLMALWVPHGAVVAIGLAAISWAARSYRRTTSPVGRWIKAALLGLRIAVLLLLTLWALRPTLEYKHQEEVRTVLLICVDTSSSMERRDVVGAGSATQATQEAEPVSRIQAVRRVLLSHRGVLAELAEEADLELVPFAASPSESRRLPDSSSGGWPRLEKAAGTATALGDAPSEAYDRYADEGRSVSGIILISDGCNNTADVIGPTKLAALMGSRDVPIHAVGVGSDRVTGLVRTLAVRDLAAPDEVEAFNRLPATAAIEAIGLQGRRVKVTCTFGKEEVGSETLSIDARQSIHPVRFVHTPLAAGYERLHIKAEVMGGSPRDLAGRPHASKLVHVVDREMRVLYVEGKFRYEAKYIARALAAARRFTIDRRVLLQPLAEKQPPALSDNPDDWLAYHAIIFGDVAASHFTRKQLEIVRDLVGKYGKGFCMIGGSSSFGRGGWTDTPIADVLPVDLRASAAQIDTPIQVVPTQEGRESDVMRLSDSGLNVAADWARLDRLPGANRLGGLKPGATVLARTPQGSPLIVAQPYGKGRSVAIAFDTTWRWVLTKKDTANLQRRFWRQVALFLAAPKGSAWIMTDKTSYDLRRLERGTDVVNVSAGVEDAYGRPAPDAPVKAKLTGPDGEESPVGLRPAGKVLKGRPPIIDKPGVYTLGISATVGGKALAAEHRFEVVRHDLESLEVLANHDLLRQMAALSDGRFVALDRFGDLLSDLRITTKPQKRDAVTSVELASRLRWPVIAALILLLCLEWAFRKRKGLV